MNADAVGVMFAFTTDREIPASDVGVPSVNVVELTDENWGSRNPVPPAGTINVSGSRSHSTIGCCEVVPLMTIRVAEYGANVMLADQAWDEPATMLIELVCESV